MNTEVNYKKMNSFFICICRNGYTVISFGKREISNSFYLRFFPHSSYQNNIKCEI